MITNHPNLNLAHSKSKKLNIVGNSKAIYLFRSNFVVVNAAERCFIKLSPPARLEPRLVVHADHVEVGSAFDREPWEGEEPHVQLRFKLERIKRLLEGSYVKGRYWPNDLWMFDNQQIRKSRQNYDMNDEFPFGWLISWAVWCFIGNFHLRVFKHFFQCDQICLNIDIKGKIILT